MKRKLLIITFLVLGAYGANAQVAGGRIRIDDLSVTEQSGQVSISFTVSIGEKAAARNATIVLVPVLTDGQYSVSTQPVIVWGKGSGTSQQRREWVAGMTADYGEALNVRNGEKIRYSANVQSQEWMDGARLRVESVTGGCCTYSRLDDVLLADNIDLHRMQPEPEPEQGWVPVTVADHLSTAFTFVVPESEYDPDEPFKIYDDERESSIVVYYHVGKYDIDPGYMDNAQTLNNLTTSIMMILNATDSRVTRIIVAGFASPEGSLELNDRLAFERAVSVKKHLIDVAGAHDSQIMIYNGSVDWRGLRAMVAKSNLPEKREVLDIIDNTPIWDSQRQAGRLRELMGLNGGSTYRYLLHEYFPYLRNGAFIKVYYENL